MTKPSRPETAASNKPVRPQRHEADRCSGLRIAVDGAHSADGVSADMTDVLWNVLHAQAHVGHGRSLQSTPLRLRIEAIRRCIQAALQDILKMGVRLSLSTEVSGPDPASSVYAIELDVEGFEAPVVVTLDAAATRSIVDGMGATTSGLRGQGAPSPAECGVMEYVLLRGFAALHGHFREADPIVTLRSFAWIDEPSVDVDDEFLGFCLSMRCGGAEGIVRVSLPAAQDIPSWVHTLPPAMIGRSDANVMSSQKAARDVLALELRWPPLSLGVQELAKLEPGDRILTDCKSLENMSPSLRIGTASGWILADCEVVSDQATRTEVRCGPLMVEAGEAPAKDMDSSDRMLNLTMGSAAVDRRRFDKLCGGTVLSFKKDRNTPVCISCLGQPVGWGELELANGDLSVRVVSVLQDVLQEVVA